MQAIDFKRRLLLLPHCLKNAEGCPADYDEFGLDCRKCGACSVADFKAKAEELGYKVLVSEGTPIVLKIIVSGHVDAIVGVACLNVLEKAIDKILLAGIPCVAAPLLSSNCRSTSVDDDWVSELIDLQTPPPETKTKTYVHLMRAAHQICEEPELSRLAPRSRELAGSERHGRRSARPLHENIAYDWLGQGGKRSRPFITLAAYDALKGGTGTLSADGLDLPDCGRRTALAIEAFHKASLVHDDIEDDDTFRYGRETLHRQYGVGTAINVGDYLIGLGYRLVSRERKELGGDCAADILDRLADAHLKLSEGQGAELLWRDAKDKTLTALDALKIYALKTAPAFEAALYAGVRLAGPADALREDGHRVQPEPGRRVPDPQRPQGLGRRQRQQAGRRPGRAGRPADAAAGPGPGRLDRRPSARNCWPCCDEPRPHAGARAGSRSSSRVRGSCSRRPQVFDKAEKLVEKFRARAEAIADEIEPTELRELLYYLVDTVLDRQPPPAPEPERFPCSSWSRHERSRRRPRRPDLSDLFALFPPGRRPAASTSWSRPTRCRRPTTACSSTSTT